ncbi:hypothetical protein IscW_ISCW003794 [Ixodes scapularis]|uniref:Uncharacterized protein n=1 Tax=Ixodes scapularis TaxID=6945 RepID=B7PIH0_IXOSC|nr:hypothetical protein IscW_ISCW003794 [Ixodes scapularis]|eukprot:XP_002405120.1 hypothetical protein IscW_ISCW003794 [Ixodes scapularis]
MPLHSFETVLRRTHEIVIGATTRDGITTTDIRRAGKPVLLHRNKTVIAEVAFFN